MIHASGGPSSVNASTRDLFSAVDHSAVAAIAAEYDTPMPTPTAACAPTRTAKSGAAPLTSEPPARMASAPSMSPRKPTRPARSPVARAAIPAASPDTVRSWPAVATETSRSRATSGSNGLRTTSAACDAASAASSVMPTARGPSRIR